MANNPTHKLKLKDDGSVLIDDKGGVVKFADVNNFPILKDMTMFYAKLEKGGLREPHWHPNASELDYVVKGKVRIGILSGDMSRETVDLEPGDICYIPRGYFHYILNLADGESELAIAFSDPNPEDIGITGAFGFLDNDLLGLSFNTSPDLFKDIPKPDGNLIVTPK